MAAHPTLIRPPPPNSSHSLIESALELTPLTDIGPDLYTNTRPLWHPPGARGIFGGAAIAQCLSAAQSTLPGGSSSPYLIHSMHCYFVLAGNSEIPVIYEVERVRDGKSFITRTVQARQKGKCIFTTTMSFMREGSGGAKTVEHQIPMTTIPPPPSTALHTDLLNQNTPFESIRAGVIQPENNLTNSPHPQLYSEKRLPQWIRARGRISDLPPNPNTPDDRDPANHQAHLSALAYMSDSYFIGSVARIHNLLRFSAANSISRTLSSLTTASTPSSDVAALKAYLTNLAQLEEKENSQQRQQHQEKGGEVGMMVSLDHTIFFHNPRAFRADEWLLSEMQSPWAGEGRGVVFQRIWSKNGLLVATCVQEGVVRLRQDREGVKEKERESKL
ncbi:MAG: hypothetical protein Q9227_007390 [Pyrenula ochraceoflavens]